VIEGGATQPLPADRRETQSVVRTLGYVEKADGEREAIVEVLGQVYLPHEGELFAGNYRALQVTPSSVKIVEESNRESSLPAGRERDSEVVRPPIPRLRVPTLSPDPSGSSPLAEVSEAEESDAGETATSATAPPEHPIESWQETNGAEPPRAARQSVRSAERSPKTDTHSTSYALKTVGLVERANGEVEAIVADEAGVRLVPDSEVRLDNPEIPNPIAAKGQSSRASFASMLKNPVSLSFPGAATPYRTVQGVGDEDSGKSLSFKARFLAPAGMTRY
jgi:hypothetical protein